MAAKLSGASGIGMRKPSFKKNAVNYEIVLNVILD